MNKELLDTNINQITEEYIARAKKILKNQKLWPTSERLKTVVMLIMQLEAEWVQHSAKTQNNGRVEINDED